eukprot:COSAG04_NODE_17636_length_463_cov_1.337912_1_plen_98_part_10
MPAMVPPTPEKRVQARLERLLRTPRGPSRTGAAPSAEPEPEQPTGTATHGGALGPTTKPADDEELDPTVAEYIRDGISAAGVLRAIELFEAELAEGAT